MKVIMTEKRRRKKRGRPRTGHDKMVGVRLPKKLLKAVDKYAERLFPYTRSAVIRKAVEELMTPPCLRGLARALRRALEQDLRDARAMGQLATDEQRLEQGQGLEEAQAAIRRAVLGISGGREEA